MSSIELYIRITLALVSVYAILVTRAYLDERVLKRWYKRHYDKMPKAYKNTDRRSACQKVVDVLLTISPIK